MSETTETSETIEFWAGEFGSEYLKRNRVDWLKRVPFWQSIIDKTDAKTLLEVGCNAGWNLQALRRANSEIEMTGVDVNEEALKEAKMAGFDVELMAADKVAEQFGHNCCSLVFTAGVLIHISPDEIQKAMTSICNATNQYVLAIEYEAEKEEMIKYRGTSDRLWKRPFGTMYQNLGFDLIETGKIGPDEGFDHCTWWLLEKQP